MRSKLGIGFLGVAVAFLLATNPVVVNAAGQITSAQIKNNTIKSKDIKDNQIKSADVKNGSLTSADLAAGTIPSAGVKIASIQLLNSAISTINGTSNYAFVGTPVTVTTTASQSVMGVARMGTGHSASVPDYHPDFCAQSTSDPTILPFLSTFNRVFPTVTAAVESTTVTGYRSLGAGTWNVGPCAFVHSGENLDNNERIDGWVQVLNTTGPVIGSKQQRAATRSER